jgi:hypothetical protein
VFTQVSIGITVRWDLAPCNVINKYRYFGETWRYEQQVLLDMFIPIGTKLHGLVPQKTITAMKPLVFAYFMKNKESRLKCIECPRFMVV